MKGLSDLREGGGILEDSQIVALYLQRDERAISLSAETYGGYCRSIAMRILRNPEDAEECVNDTWLHAWNSIPPHQPEVLSAYLGKMTRWICLKKWRALRSQKRGGGEVDLAYEELSESIPDSRPFNDILTEKALAESLTRFLKVLPEKERRVFLRRYWFFDSVAQISSSMGFSQSKVKTMLWRIRKKLMDHLKKEGFFG